MGFARLATKSGHNMFTMASLLQKAIRRGDAIKAGYAANELYGSYSGVMWNRMMTIAAEDCWGILSKELVYLRAKDEHLNRGVKGYFKDPRYVSAAIYLLANAKKSRDACYFACNFILSPNKLEPIEITREMVLREKIGIKMLPSEVFDYPSLGDNAQAHLRALLDQNCGEQISLAACNPLTEKILTTLSGFDAYEMATLAIWAIRLNDMENLGYAMNELRSTHRDVLWKALLLTSVRYGSGQLAQEIIGLKLTDNVVNRNKTADKRDEIYLSKAAMLLCYEQRGMRPLESSGMISPYQFVEWDCGEFDVPDIAGAYLEDGTVPEYVYDVHTIKGKRAGHTDWEMNLVEQAALSPLRLSFFDEGSWAPRYDWKHEHNACTDKEYLESLEYRKTHPSNPVKRVDAPSAIAADENANGFVYTLVEEFG